MLLTLDEHELMGERLREARMRKWGAVLLGGNEAILVVRIVVKPASADEERTLLTTARGIRDAIDGVLPAAAVAAHAVCLSGEVKSWAIEQVWLPASSEKRKGALLRLSGESHLRDESLRVVPSVDGRRVFLSFC